MKFHPIILLTLLASCKNLEPRKQKDLETVAAKAPTRYTAALPDISRSLPTQWLTDFREPRLRTLVDQALTGNHEIRLAAARVREAQALLRSTRAARRLQVDTDFSGSRSQRPAGTRFAGLGALFNRFEQALDISWEMDVWGRLADRNHAAAADAESLAEDEQMAKLSLAAGVVRSMITLTEATLQAQLADDNVKSQRAQLQIVQKQLQRGINSDRGALDLSLGMADLARAESNVHARNREVDAGRRSLELLLGSYPAGAITPLSALPNLSSAAPADLPSALLLRRPDIRSAERRMAASLATESAARKALLPSFRLSSSNGFNSAELASMLTQESLLWSLAGSVSQAIFQGGKLKAEIEAARARYDQALERYAQSALVAFREVETALAADQHLRLQEEALAQASTEAARSADLARTSYERGLSDILTMLDAQRRAFDAKSALITTQATRIRNRVDLHLALGGGY